MNAMGTSAAPEQSARKRKSFCTRPLGAGVDGKISRREKSKEREREQTTCERKRCKPPGKETAHNTTISDANLTSAERTERHALDERRKETGRAEQQAPAPFHLVRFDVVLPENKCRTAKDDSDQHQSERNIERRHHGGECRRKGGKQNDDDKYQPYVVSLPDWSDGPFDGGSLRAGARSSREQIPHAATVIGVAGDGIKNQRREHETGDNELKHFS